MKQLALFALALALTAGSAFAQANTGTSQNQGSQPAPAQSQAQQGQPQAQQGSQAQPQNQPELALPNGAERAISAKGEQRITKEVRHVLVMEPYYTLWDNLAYEVNGDTVTLLGKVVNGTLKSDAEHDVSKIEGVKKVINKIEVLPPSSMDDRIRVATARAIFNADGLSRYAWGAVPPIHIIVENGHVTLDGVVDNPTDKQMAGMQANGVPGVFSVKNDLRVANTTTEAKK